MTDQIMVPIQMLCHFKIVMFFMNPTLYQRRIYYIHPWLCPMFLILGVQSFECYGPPGIRRSNPGQKVSGFGCRYGAACMMGRNMSVGGESSLEKPGMSMIKFCDVVIPTKQ